MSPPETALQNLPHHRDGLEAAAVLICDPRIPVIVHAHVARGITRFDGFVAEMGIARNILSARLKQLVASGLIEKVPQAPESSRHDYLPTEKFISLGDVLLVASGVAPTTAPAVARHENCGAPVRATVVCGSCIGADVGRVPSRLDPWEVLSGVPTASVTAWFTAELGDSWSVRVLSCAYHGDTTFDAMVDRLGIARNILADRLKKLVNTGLLVKSQYNDKPRRFQYLPTDSAHQHLAFMAVLGEWGASWCLPGGQGGSRPRHRKCGKAFRPVVFCGACPVP